MDITGGYRILRIANITLTLEQESDWNADAARFSDPHFDAPWLNAEPDPVDEQLRVAYLAASEARERWEIGEHWHGRLLLLRSEMNATERKIYGRRIDSLIVIARATIAREMRRTKFEAYEDHLGTSSKTGPKIHINGWTDDITRIHESAAESGLYSRKPEVSQIAVMYHNERQSRDLTANIRASRSRSAGRRTESPKLMLFMKKMLEKFTPKSIEEIAAYAMTLLERSGR